MATSVAVQTMVVAGLGLALIFSQRFFEGRSS
jgi:hypothetical protein